MKLFKQLINVIVIVSMISSCSLLKGGSKKSGNDDAKPADTKNFTEIVFGWGGGFTGMIDEYHLLKDGTLKQGNDVKKKLDAKQMKAIVKLFKKINFSKVKLNDPGNLYYFLAAKSGNNESRLTWNDLTQLPPEVRTTYDELIKLTH